MRSTENTNRNLITALYCRLSQEDERLGESLSIENQRLMLQRYAEEHRFPNIQFYVDDGFSGADFNRPSFKRIDVYKRQVRKIPHNHKNVRDACAQKELVQLLPVPVIADQVNDWQYG